MVILCTYELNPRDNIESFVRSFEVWAPLAYALLYIICAPIPFLAPLFTAVGGLLFGTWRGTLYVLVISSISALVPFTLSRRLGREWVAGQIKNKQRLSKVYQQSEGQKGLTFIILLRLIPILPWEIQNYVAGLTKVAIPTFLLGTIIGIIPGSFSLVFLGSSVTDPTSWQFFVAVTLKVITALIPVVAIYIRNRRH